MPTWIVSSPDRLDTFLAQQGTVLSRAKAQTAIEEGCVMLNDHITKKPAQRLQEGDKVTLNEDPRNKMQDTKMEPVDMHLEVLYEDDACLVLNKPAGIAVHPGAGMLPDEKTLLDGIAFLFKKRKIHQRDDGVLVHRLDRETTGCILVAKTPEAHMALQKQFETRTVKKFYLAIVAGVPSPASATIDAPIGRSTANRTKMAVLGSSATREAQTTYRTLDAVQDAALIECELHTGRTHQIRIHLSTVHHPILGDGSYHDERADRLSQEHDIRDLCLHARKLIFHSPADDADHEILADLPPAFTGTMKKLGLRYTV